MKYGYQKGTENTAKAAMRDVSISSKAAIEMANHLRYKTTSWAKKELTEIQKMKKALPFKRFHNGLGHKKGAFMSGRYPVNAAAAFLQLIESVEANASNLTLGSNLKIVHLSANRASNSFRFGRRQRRQKRKLTHLEIVVQEFEEKKKAAAKKETKKEETKPEVKAPKVEKKTEVKEEKKSDEKPVEDDKQ